MQGAKEEADDLMEEILTASEVDCYSVITYSVAKEIALITIKRIRKAVKGMVDENSGYSCDDWYREVESEIEKL